MAEDQIALMLAKLTTDLKRTSWDMDDSESRYLVGMYYSMQDQRIALNNQLKALAKAKKPNATIQMFTGNFTILEEQIKAVLEAWVTHRGDTAQWCLQQTGLGPILTAGLFAHIDIKRAITVGHIWNFAGLNPGAVWVGGDGARKVVDALTDNKTVTPEQIVEAAHRMGACPKWLSGRIYRQLRKQDLPFRDLPNTSELDYVSITLEGLTITRKSIVDSLARRPWNAELKTLCWKIGESFVKVSARPNAYYGQIFAIRKRFEIMRNIRGEQSQTALQILGKKKFKAGTDAKLWYSGCLKAKHMQEYYRTPTQQRLGFAKRNAGAPNSGIPMLPPGHLQARARRATVKLFLSHWHHIRYFEHYGKEPPLSYSVSHLNHAHSAPPPGWRGTPLEVPDDIPFMKVHRNLLGDDIAEIDLEAVQAPEEEEIDRDETVEPVD